jgi:threonine dehydrogenase-like Zn-dependent dehydrogenase
VTEGSTVVVVGDGAVGLCAVLASTEVLGAERVILLSRNPARQAVGRQFGATDIVEGRGEEARQAVLALTDGHGAPSVVEAVGTPDSWQSAIDTACDGGQIGAVGVPHTAPTVATMPLLARNLGVRVGIAPVGRYLAELTRRVTEDGLAPAPVFDLTLPLAETAAAYAAMDRREAIKVALVP